MICCWTCNRNFIRNGNDFSVFKFNLNWKRSEGKLQKKRLLGQNFCLWTTKWGKSNSIFDNSLKTFPSHLISSAKFLFPRCGLNLHNIRHSKNFLFAFFSCIWLFLLSVVCTLTLYSKIISIFFNSMGQMKEKTCPSW